MTVEEYNDSNENEDAEVTQICANDVWDEMIHNECGTYASSEGD